MSLPAAPPGWLLGVDTSAAQGRLDVSALADAGVGFVYMRATDGEHSIDKQWDATVQALHETGILCGGAYGVLEPYGAGRSGAQAKNFAGRVRDAGMCLPPALDFELAKGLTGLEAVRSAVAWCDVVEQALGRRCLVYTGPAFIDELAALAGPAGAPVLEALAARPLWLAHYTGSYDRLPRVPAPWGAWSVWQASGGRKASPRNGATLPGSAVEVDVDFYRGTMEELRRLGCPAG